ncbi:MAG: hypothetical protein MRY64_10365 [Hyphomonadaceae bacterium]|nr:hypothetical protein [Hyphomonadaceae bacterium]
MPVERVRRDHIGAIIEIAERCGFPARSPNAWRWILFGNPDQGDLPSGFISCNAEGRPEAFLGTLVMRVRRGDRERTIVCGHTFISSQPGAGHGSALMAAVLANYRPVPLVTVNNNARSAPMLQKMGYSPWTRRERQQTLTWPLRDNLHAAGRALNYLGRKDTLYRLLAQWEWFSNRVGWPAAEPASLMIDPRQTEDLVTLHEALHALNAAAAKDSWAIARTVEGFLWRLADPDAPGRSCLFLHPQGHLAMVTLTKLNRHEPPIAQITDLALRPGANWKGGALELMQAIHRQAAQAGAAALRLSPVLDFPIELAGAIGPYRASTPDHDSCHVFSFPDGLQADEIRTSLAAGDQFFALRTVPDKSPAVMPPIAPRDKSSSAESPPSVPARTKLAKGW